MSTKKPSASDLIIPNEELLQQLGAPAEAIKELTSGNPMIAAMEAAKATAAATVEDCNDDDEDDKYVDDETLLNETPIEYVEPTTTTTAAVDATATKNAQETSTTQKSGADDEKQSKTIVHYIKDGKLGFTTLFGEFVMHNKEPKKPSVASSSSSSDEKSQPKNAQLMKEFTLAANRCGDFLAGLVKGSNEDENGLPLKEGADSENILWRLDQQISNEILAQRSERKSRKPDLKKEILHVARVYELPKPKPGDPPRAKDDSGWSAIETHDLRDERVASYYDSEQIKRYDDLEPNNSAVRLLVIETMFETEAIHARLRMYVLFRIKWKDDKEIASFNAARANVKKPDAKTTTGRGGAVSAKKPSTNQQQQQAPAIIAPINVQQSSGKFLDKNTPIVLATFWECNPIEKHPKKFLKKLFGKDKKKIIAAADLPELNAALAKDVKSATPDATAAVDDMPKLEETAPQPSSAAATSNNSSSTSSSATSAAATTLSTATEPATSKEKKDNDDDDGDDKELSDETKKEIKTLSENYQAKCMAIQICVYEYSRLRYEARTNMFQNRIDSAITFLLMSFGFDLCMRIVAARPNIAEPLALVAVLERNGSIVNLDETTFITLSQLEVLKKTEPAQSATMKLYRELEAAFNDKRYNPRSHIIMHLLERGKGQDLGQNIQRTTISDFNYEQMEAFVNSQLKANQKPGEPKTIAEYHAAQMRAAHMAQQQIKQSKAPPAT